MLRAASAPAMSMGDPVALQVLSGIILGVCPHVRVPFGVARHYPQHLNLSCALWGGCRWKLPWSAGGCMEKTAMDDTSPA